MEWLRENLSPEVVWFIVGLVLLLAEFMVPGLIIAFFAVGAWVVALVCVFRPMSINAQLGLFIVSSVVALLVVRQRIAGMFKGFTSGEQDGNVDLNDFIGQRAVVTKAITSKLPGQVEFHGSRWLAEAAEEIPEGAVVEITGKDNLTLKVKVL
ncbi:MAG: NfeD family protein [Sedimentisphaerales bacterium]|nr:NfeD family protein [Sedimentisphaerales bacterium]